MDRLGITDFLRNTAHLEPDERISLYESLPQSAKLEMWEEYLPPLSTLSPGGIEAGELMDGAQFALDQDNAVAPLWGTERQCLWSKGEPFYVFASPGVGKTTMVQQLALRRAGIKGGDLLGLPVEVDERRVLYIAADRHRQAARSIRRMIDESHRESLAQGFAVWRGPPPFSLPTQPDALLPWVKGFSEIGTVIVDSLFNVAPSVSTEEGAAATNTAFQSLVNADVDVIVIHHDKKRQEHERKRVSQDDMYGGRPISGGAGSIVYLDGEPNTARYTLRHLKSPSGPVGPLDVVQNFTYGEVEQVPPEAGLSF